MPDQDAAGTSGLPDLSKANLRALLDRRSATVLDTALDRLLNAGDEEDEPTYATFNSKV